MIQWPVPERALVASRVLSFHEREATELPRGVLIGAGRILALFEPDDRAARRDLGVPVGDLGDTVLMPGFVDAHNHLPSAVLDSFAVPTAHVLSTGHLVAELTAAIRVSSFCPTSSPAPLPCWPPPMAATARACVSPAEGMDLSGAGLTG